MAATVIGIICMSALIVLLARAISVRVDRLLSDIDDWKDSR